MKATCCTMAAGKKWQYTMMVDVIIKIFEGIGLSAIGCVLIFARKISVDALEAPEKALWKKPGSYPFGVEGFIKIRGFFFLGAAFLLGGILVICTELYKVITCFFT